MAFRNRQNGGGAFYGFNPEGSIYAGSGDVVEGMASASGMMSKAISSLGSSVAKGIGAAYAAPSTPEGNAPTEPPSPADWDGSVAKGTDGNFYPISPYEPGEIPEVLSIADYTGHTGWNYMKPGLPPIQTSENYSPYFMSGGFAHPGMTSGYQGRFRF